LLYLLCGQDDFSLKEALKEIKKELGEASLLETNTSILNGQAISPGELNTVVGAAPFLAEKRLVIVTGLLGRFQSRKDAGNRRESGRIKGETNGHRAFKDIMENLPQSTVLVLVEEEVGKENPLLKELPQTAIIKAFPFMKKGKLELWIRQRVAREGGRISPGAVDLLSRLVGSDLWIMSAEIAKLVLYASGRIIEEADIKEMVGYTQEASIFTMVDAILERRIKQAVSSLSKLFESGYPYSYMLHMLARQVRLVIRLSELMNRGLAEKEIRSVLGLTKDFVWHKTRQQAKSYSLKQLKEVYGRLLDTDVAIKTSRYQGELALDILVVELCRQGRS